MRPTDWYCDRCGEHLGSGHLGEDESLEPDVPSQCPRCRMRIDVEETRDGWYIRSRRKPRYRLDPTTWTDAYDNKLAEPILPGASGWGRPGLSWRLLLNTSPGHWRRKGLRFRHGWHESEWRIATWLARGVPFKVGFCVGAYLLVDAGWRETDNWVKQIRNSLLRAMDLSMLMVEGLETPWGVQPVLHLAGRDHHVRCPKSYDPYRLNLWRGCAAMAQYAARGLHRRGHEHWWRPWLASLDSYVVLPEYPLDAWYPTRTMVLPHPQIQGWWEYRLLVPNNGVFYNVKHPEADWIKRPRWMLRAGNRWDPTTRCQADASVDTALQDWGIHGGLREGRTHPRGWPDPGWPAGYEGPRFQPPGGPAGGGHRPEDGDGREPAAQDTP